MRGRARFGLGSIYTKQEKFALAEYHFRRALEINPQSSVLYCHLSLTLQQNRKFDEALEMLRIAATMDPRNPQVWFQRASILMAMERNEEALEQLENVRAHSPKESQVYFFMGKVCKKLGRIDEALRHFTFALDLDPKDNTQIKVRGPTCTDRDLEFTGPCVSAPECLGAIGASRCRGGELLMHTLLVLGTSVAAGDDWLCLGTSA